MSDEQPTRTDANSNRNQPVTPTGQAPVEPQDGPQATVILEEHNGHSPEDLHALHDRWPALPDGITIADGVDLRADDPTLVDTPVNAGQDTHSHRRCIATNRDGNRCATRAMHTSLLCPQHAGRISYDKAREAKRAHAAERNQRAESVLQLQKLGTRALIAEKLVREAEKVDRAIGHLLDAAAGGDLASAKLLLGPTLDQAFGKPQERVEVSQPTSLEDLEEMSEAELAALVRRGRERRLRLAEQPEAETAS